MATQKIGWTLWLGGLSLLWACQPLLVSPARGVWVLSLVTLLLALLGWVGGVQVLVTWSGGAGLCNLTLALVLVGHPPSLWTGISAGLTLLILLDSSHRFTYLRHCWLAPGVLPVLFGTLIGLSSVTLALGVLLGLTLVLLQPVSSSATGAVTIVGAGLLVSALALFLITEPTSIPGLRRRQSAARSQDDAEGKAG